MRPDDVPAPTPTPDQIHVAIDWINRDVIVVPDDVARRMNRDIEDGWQECRGFAYGQSRRFPTGTWLYEVTTTLMAAFAGSPVPDDLPEYVSNRAYGLRLAAAMRWHLRANIVGASGWDPNTRSFRQVPAHIDLHVRGSAAFCYGHDAVQYAG